MTEVLEDKDRNPAVAASALRFLDNFVPQHTEIALQTREVAERGSELKNAARQMRDYQQLLGIDSFAIYDTSNDIDLISSSLLALRSQTALGARLMLRLAGQFDAGQTRELCSNLHGCGLTCVADPCASLALAIEASLNQLPALALSVWRYEREELLKYLPETPPAVLLVDPLMEGGPTAVRKLASIARVLQTEICLTAEAGGSWLTYLCAEIAAVVPASLQPVQLPAEASTKHSAGTEEGRWSQRRRAKAERR